MKSLEFLKEKTTILMHLTNVETSLLRNKICTSRFILNNKHSCSTLSVIRESFPDDRLVAQFQKKSSDYLQRIELN